jgi:superfamily II DNA or RNA helicase
MSDKEIFIVALTEHRNLGLVYVPCLAEQLQTCLEVKTILRVKDLNNFSRQFTEKEKEIVRLANKTSQKELLVKFSRSGTPDEFFSPANQDTLKKQVIPFIEKQIYLVTRLLMGSGIPLYRKEAKYARLYEEDQIMVPADFSTARFEFDRQTDGTRYRLRIFHRDEEIRMLNRTVSFLCQEPCIMLLHNRLFVFPDISSKKIGPFTSQEELFVDRETEEKYFRNFVSRVIADHEVTASGFTLEDRIGDPEPLLCLEPDLAYHPVFVLRFRYSGEEIVHNERKLCLLSADYSGDNYSFTRIHRNPGRELELIKFLASVALEEKSGVFSLPKTDMLDYDQAVYHLVNWLSANLEILKSHGFEVRQLALAKRYFTGTPEVRMELKSKSDWFDVYAEVRFGQYRIPFIKLRKYILNDIREFQLPDGEIVILPEEWFSKFKTLYPFAKGEGFVLTFHRHHIHLFGHETFRDLPELFRTISEEYENIAQVRVPEDLQAELRNYQVDGFRWMYTLYKNKVGGCLADDMGLGKTVQAIAYLLKIKKLTPSATELQPLMKGQLPLFEENRRVNGQPASLIVMPTSLVHNWESELARFAPGLSVHKHTGSQRMISWQTLSPDRNFDVILTTYGTLRNDVEWLKDIWFTAIILDESQQIKNPASKGYRSVIDLKSKHRMVLTGTPIENSLSDLWAQMNFLNRGLLGSYAFFNQNFRVPIENDPGCKAVERLQLLVRPFILRRTKEEVASDLPALTEQVIYCEMKPEQESAYEKEKSVIRNTILSSIENNGIRKSSLAILRGLMRLRQLANHPRILDAQSRNESGKFSEVFDLLRNIIAEKHKVLVFSSFVTHLDLIREQVEEEKWTYSYLTGSSRNRKEIIRKFQEDPLNPIFLISIKAGGVGLNLTGADYVFILDPWWNPAVENQAVNRAHRIGQDKPVFVYRFITENTVEEKIERLKEKKSRLAGTIIHQNDPFTEFSEEEILSLL